MATQPPNTPHEGLPPEINRWTTAEINAEIDCLRTTATHSRRRQKQTRTCQDIRDSVLDQILEKIRGLQGHISRLEVTSYDHYANPSRRYKIEGCPRHDSENWWNFAKSNL